MQIKLNAPLEENRFVVCKVVAASKKTYFYDRNHSKYRYKLPTMTLVEANSLLEDLNNKHKRTKFRVADKREFVYEDFTVTTNQGFYDPTMSININRNWRSISDIKKNQIHIDTLDSKLEYFIKNLEERFATYEAKKKKLEEEENQLRYIIENKNLVCNEIKQQIESVRYTGNKTIEVLFAKKRKES